MQEKLIDRPPCKRRYGDRSDGWRVVSADPFFAVVPHIMNMRCDAQVYFDQVVEIGELERFIRNLRRTTGMTELSLMHVVLAACVRMFAQYPCVNRFVCGRRIYARNEIVFCFTIKKDMTLDAPEAIVKVVFDPTDTLQEVYDKISGAVTANKGSDAQNDTDAFANLLSYCPNWLVRAVVGAANFLDHCGILPSAVRAFSPFHCSMFLTDIGSTGIGSVYHHLYNFGTCSIFCALGKKGRVLKQNDDGQIVYTKTVNLRFTVDERVTDGFYYAYTFREFLKLLRKPDELLNKPDAPRMDPGLRKTRKERRAARKQQALAAESAGAESSATVG